MNVKAQVAMVMNLDKCIGCHTCSVTCKNTWTNRPGVEYMWWNNVETRPGVGYPREWEDQDRYHGGWTLREGRLTLGAGGALTKYATIFGNPDMPTVEDFYEPWTYNYEVLLDSPHRQYQPVARPKTVLTDEWIDGPRWGPNWDDDLAGGREIAPHDPNLRGLQEHVAFEYEHTFMMYLPRICEHCLNPSCAASCPAGAIYKRDEDGVVLVDQEACRGWRFRVSGCPYKKVYFNWNTHKAEKCTFCYPRVEAGLPTVCSETCVGRLRYLGVVLYDADRVLEAAATPDVKDLRAAQLELFLDPRDPRVAEAARAAGITDAWIEAAERSPVYRLAVDWRVALPLHPEYRTLPMVWYVPPLSPIMNHVERTTPMDDRTYLAAVDQMRIPMAYLASILAAGDVGLIRETLVRLVAMRVHMRRQTVGDVDDTALLRESGMSAQELEDMARLLGVAKYDERFVIPTARRESDPNLTYEQGACGLEGLAPPEGPRWRRWTTGTLGPDDH